MKGKNFSCNNAEGKRIKGDQYQTPLCLTRLLLDEVTLEGPVLEPCCGQGYIVRVLKELGYECAYQDVDADNAPHKDFFDEQTSYPTILTNPPYSQSFQFLQHAKTLAQDIYFLLPLSYLHGKKRHDDVYQDKAFPLKRVFVFTRYPLLEPTARDDGTHSTGMMVYAWFHFSKGHMGAPTIQWLDNNAFVKTL